MATILKKNSADDASREASPDVLASEKRFRESLADLEASAASVRGDRSEEGCALDPTCRAAELKVELYKAEHDNAGAFKFKRFSRETLGMFVSEKIKLDEETGEYALPAELGGRRYLFVSMGELDRLNKEGHSQEAGDAGLRAVIKACDEASAKYLGAERAANKNIFRYGGNEYCVEFDDIKPEELAAIENAIKNSQLDLGPAYQRIEAPPLSTSRIDLLDALKIMNDITPAGEPLDAYEAGYKTMNVLRRQIDHKLEVEKFITRAERALEKALTAKTKAEAKDFFNNYLKKGFYGTGWETIEDVEAFARGKTPDALRAALEWMADDAAEKKFAEERKLDQFEDHLVDVRHHELLGGGAPRTDTDEMERDFDTRQKIAVIPPLTRGLAALARANFEKIRAQGTKWAGVKELEYEIERAKRDEGTGLLERGQFYEDWNGHIERAEATGKNASVVFIDMGFLKYFNDAGGRRVGDAALRKAAELMEEALDKAKVKGVAYRYGGDEFAIRVEGGRAEAKLVTDALDALRAKAGRIPGLDELREQGLGEKDNGKSRADYAPTELVFNSGAAEIKDFFTILNDLREAGELKKILATRGISENEFKAELMVKLADTSVNYEKAVSRFHLLIELMAKPAYRDEGSAYHARVESIVKYSQKAIIGDLGGDAALRVFAESVEANEVSPHIKEQIERFVSDRIEKLKEITAGQKELVDKLVELHAAQSRLLEQVNALKAELAGKTDALAHEHERVLELGAKQKAAEQAYQDLVAARQEVVGAVLDKKAQTG